MTSKSIVRDAVLDLQPNMTDGAQTLERLEYLSQGDMPVVSMSVGA